ncbi:MAG: glycosyl hydrolase [Rhodanobacteraceae bacterium]|nr:MAG: glycosyl hydrolase [Rhodanobacteraceae bacterium]
MTRARRYWVAWLVLGLLWMVPAAYAASVPAAKLTSALHWRSIGPYMGGRVTSVAGVAGEPNRFYAGYAGGGVWETTDYGGHWKNLSDKYFSPATSGTVGAMAVAPSNPKIIYVGTGDSAPRNTVLTGHGVYKSTDGGKTWKFIGLGDTHIITWILVDPKNPNVVYVGALGHLFAPNADRGVFKSTDGGKTWKKILFVDDGTGVATMAMDPKNPNVLYASMWQMSREPWSFSSGGPSSGIYKSTDGGAHWQNISHNPGLPSGVLGKVGLAVAPSDPNVVYALVQAHVTDSAPGGLYRSNDAGKTWKLVNTSMAITQRAFYYMRVYVDPKDANTIWLPNVDLLVSHDGGKTLKKVSTPHGDNHALWVNPNNPQIMIEGNDGGATVTLNGGKSWSSEMNQPTGQFYHANLDNQFPFHIYGAQQDRGSVEGPSAARGSTIPPVWKNVIGGELGWVVPTPGQPWVSYGSGYYGLNYKENRRIAVLTNVTPYPGYQFGHKGASIKYRFGWTFHPIAFAPSNPKMLLVGANVVFKTLDEGIHWTVISPDLTRNDKSKQQRPGGPISADVTGEEMYDTISSIAISPFSDDTIWVGTDDGLVQLTTDGGKTWNQVRPPDMPTWAIVSSIDASPTARGTAYVTASRYMWDDFHPYVYKTTDFGKHWTTITNGLPTDEYAMSIRQDPVNPKLLFLGTSASVYMSLDGGAHWQSLALNLPAVVVSDIQIQPEQHAVVLSTFGRAFWVLDNLQFLEQLGSADVRKDSPYLFKPQQAWLVKRSTQGSDKRIGGTNLPAGATVFFHLPADYNGKTEVKLDIEDASGKLVNSYTLPVKPEPKQDKIKDEFAAPKKPPAKLHPGMNSFHWNLRYPDAVDVKGVFHTFVSAQKPVGPEVMPGKYFAVLHYGRTTQKQPFEVKLDPRMDTTQAGLQQRFDLLMRIHDAINSLDRQINQAIDTRSALQKALAKKRVDANAANQAVATLDRDIDGVVNLKIQSDEGGLVYAPQLRAWLSAISDQVSFAFVRPTPSMVEVANDYIAESGKAVQRLQSDTAAAKAVLKH